MYTPRMKGYGEKVEITDLETGNKTVYGSIRLAAESISVSHPTIHKRDKDFKNTGVNKPIKPKIGGLFLSVIKIKEIGTGTEINIKISYSVKRVKRRNKKKGGYSSKVEQLYVEQSVPCSNQGIHPKF